MRTDRETANAGLTIGEVARRTGVPSSTLRYYESIGLLPAPRRLGGQRRYDSAVLQRLAVIGLAKDSGFSIVDIQTLFEGFEPALPTPAAGRWKELAQRKFAELDGVISRARAMQQLLEQSLCCECLELDECALIASGQEARDGRKQALPEQCAR